MAYFNSVRSVTVSAVMVAVAAAMGIHVFGYWARQAAHAELLLVRIGADLHELSSLEWESISRKMVDAGIEQKAARVRQSIDKLMEAVQGSDKGMQEVSGFYRDYSMALEHEFDLIRSGKIDQAHEFDESVVDPRFEKLHERIEKLVAEKGEEKERIGLIAEIGVAVSMLGAGLIVACMFAAFTASRSRQGQKLKQASELAELSADSSWEQDQNFRFTTASAGGLGKALPAPIIGAALWELPVDPQASDWPAHRVALAAHQPFKNFEYKLQPDDMPVQWISSSGKPQFDAAGNFTGYRGTTRNITERKQAEEALRRSRLKLRQLAAHQDRVREDERKRIARDIHDELGQNLLVLRLDVARMRTDPDLDAATQEHLEAALLQIDTTIKSVRIIINDLRPSVLDLGLHAAIQWQANEFERRTGIACEVHIDHAEFELDDQSATALFRSGQEALSNVIRHAKASRVWIGMQRKDDQLYMTIADDGIGGSPGCSRKKNSFGLIGIEERMHALGGNFSTSSEPGQGMKVVLSIPIGQQAYAVMQ
jgi:signal transduction histidine kinase